MLPQMISYFGSKYRSGHLYPLPKHGTIIEPFAGSAGYASNYPEANVLLSDADPVIAGVWDYLIRAKREEIMSLPVGFKHLDEVKGSVCQEAKWLMGFWMNPGSSSPKKSYSRWKRESYLNDPGFWSIPTREAIARGVEMIKHWKVQLAEYPGCPNQTATWYIDGPYQLLSRHYSAKLRESYSQLAEWCKSRRGQVIVCEQQGADWLPFEPLEGEVRTSRGISKELIWLGGTDA